MENKREWSREEREDGIVIYRNILTDTGLLDAVYLGPGGAFIILQDCSDPASAFPFLRDLLHCSKMGLYLLSQGLYSPEENAFYASCTDESDSLSEEYLHKQALLFVDGSDLRQVYTQEGIKRVGDRLIRADANARGWYLDEEGQLYIRHGNVFRAASSHDPDTVFYTALFGGSLGFHRFLIGKFFSGFLYLITGGLFLTGWAIDLIFLYLGALKDKQNKVIAAPSHRLRKLLVIPVGLVVSVFLFTLAGSIFMSLTSSATPFDPSTSSLDLLQNAQSILNTLESGTNSFSGRFLAPFQN